MEKIVINVSVIIVNYNTYLLTRNCIRSIYDNTIGLNYEIIVVDNDSRDNSVEQLKNEFPNLTLIANKDNLGFGQANNIGVSKAVGQYVFLLNSDTILHNNAISIFYDFFNDNRNLNIGVLGSLLLNEDGTIGKSSSDLPSFISIFIGTMKGIFYRLFLRKSSGFVQDVSVLNFHYKKVGQVIGADMFMEKSTYITLKGFDPIFFMYFEETDLQKRLTKLGYNIFLVCGPRITHLEGRSNQSFTKYVTYYKSMYHYFRKNLF